MIRSDARRIRLAILPMGCLALAVGGATAASAPKAPPLKPAGAQAPYINITSTPPNDVAVDASPEDLAKFAWQQFLALSWKAGFPGTQRGQPDPQWSYNTPGAFPALMTWQTYAQTTELRPNGQLKIPWAQLRIPQYSYQMPITRGLNNPNAQNNLWNNLDEDNEIGSCDTYGQYKNQPNPKQLVLYQVKVSQDEYEYLRVNYGRDQASKSGLLGRAQSATSESIKKPPSYVYYSPGFPGNCGPCDPAKAICLPCGGAPNPAGGTYTGSIEVKSAWRMLQKGDNKDHFFTTNALYYDMENGKLVYKNGTFALIGIHIIHKTKNYPDFIFTTFEQVEVATADMEFIHLSPPPPPPSTRPVLPRGTQISTPVTIERQTGQTNREQLHPVPTTLDTVTNRVHGQLKGLNSNTIWQYYRLTGVQGHPVNCQPNFTNNNAQICVSSQNPVQCTQLDPNYFMANFVIESDPFLNNFSGPGFGGNPFKNCNNIVSFSTSPQSGVTQGIQRDMGGCKGCHGVAQTAFGTDFSFLLDFGNNKPSVQPATVIYYRPSNSTSVALKRYLKGNERPLIPLPKQ
jgi:hypothetical protein